MAHGLTTFINKFKIGARPNLFRVETFILGDDCEFFCKGAQIPGRSINKMPISYLDNQFYLGGDTTYQDWTINVMNDIDFNIRFKIEEWMNLVKQQGNSRGFSGWSYLNDIRVTQLDSMGNDVITYILYNAFPIDTSPIDLSWETESAIQEYQTIFSFTHFGKEEV